MAPAPLGQHWGGWTVQPGLSPRVKDTDAVAVNLIVGMEWPKTVGPAPKDIHVTAQHCGRVEVPPACRVALGRSKDGTEKGSAFSLSSLWFLKLRMGVWKRGKRADLCTDQGPHHGAGIQLVDVIGKAVSLIGMRKEVKEGIKERDRGHSPTLQALTSEPASKPKPLIPPPSIPLPPPHPHPKPLVASRPTSCS